MVAYQNVNGIFSKRSVPIFDTERQGRFVISDINGDGSMEVISLPVFTIYQLISPFRFRDATSDFAPDIKLKNYAQMAACEFDMDNDGDFDLYIARGWERITDNKKLPRENYSDVLLENRNGVYIDVTVKAGLHRRTKKRSMGVSPGDFNNDGFVDLMVTTNQGPDVILTNNGDGTFSGGDRSGRGPVRKPNGTRSDNTVAVDYDLDGRVDLIQGQGMTRNDLGHIGVYRVVKNETPRNQLGNYLLVYVGNDPSGAATSLHAIVTVFAFVRGSRFRLEKMIRRVGARGMQRGGPSNIDTVHFGLGQANIATRVTVRWVSGTIRKRREIPANQKISIGMFHL